MIRLKFQCDFITDIVLNAHTATEGTSKSLDYIPGSVFLGILAKHIYKEQTQQDSYNIFHSNKVLFGDAHIAHNGKRTLKIPCSIFNKKGDSIEDELYIQSEIHKDINEQMISEGIQLKQVRKGFFEPESKYKIEINKHYSQKSAHDRETRSSKEGKMFGYESLEKGSSWIFYIDCEDETYIDTITAKMQGEQTIGRSRSAQYGLVKISYLGKTETTPNITLTSGEHILYAESDIMFLNKYGQATFSPTELFKEVNSQAIVWDKSQIRTREYAPWNAKRQARDADRIVIEKGSVIYFNLEKDTTISGIEKGIGYYCNEGLGKIIIDPEFLLDCDKSTGKLNYKLYKHTQTTTNNYFTKEISDSDENIISWLEQRKVKEDIQNNIRSCVLTFVDNNKSKYKGISSSQWGGVRNIAFNAIDKKDLSNKLFEDADAYLTHGEKSSLWEKNNRLNILKNEFIKDKGVGSNIDDQYFTEYIEKLASQMQMQKQN